MNIIEINRENLIHNVNYFKGTTKAKICAMVKANGYGHNAVAVAQILSNYVDYFGVNNIDEAIELRQNGIKNNILVVGVFEKEDIANAYDYDIELTVDNAFRLDEIIESNLAIKVHIAVNTGMNRLGFCVNDISDVVFRCKNSNVILVGIFTHFATADMDKEYFDYQIKSFNQALSLLDTKGIIIHASNTSGLSDKRVHYDMVRIGIGLYGYGNKNLLPVMKVKSKVVAIHKISKGERVGYSNGYIADEDCYIAVVPLGYADGINRHIARRVYVRINGKLYLVASNICMDMFMVKVDKDVKLFDEVVVMDNADIWAKELDTIPYEVLTGFEHRRFNLIVK